MKSIFRISSRCTHVQLLVASLLLLSCGSEKRDIGSLLDDYIQHANAHDIPAVKRVLAYDVVWHLGSDTLRGVEEVLSPIRFDVGARTRLAYSNVHVSGDTIDFDLTETNQVLTALGIPQLHQFIRLVCRDGLIIYIGARRPPKEMQLFVERVITFSSWLKRTDSAAHAIIWGSSGKFLYNERTGSLMSRLAEKWRVEYLNAKKTHR